MIPATQTVHEAHFAALTTGAGNTALVALGVAATEVFDGVAVQGTTLPYVIYSSETETEPPGRRTDENRATEVVITTTCWASHPKLAKEIAETVATHAVTYAFSLSGVTGGVTIDCRLDLFGPTFSDGVQPQAFGCPVAVRYLIYQDN